MRQAATVWLCFLSATSVVAAADVDYLGEVKPIFKERCFACHGALKQEGSLRLDAGFLIRKGGDSGPAISPGNSNESVLLERISDPDPVTRMPPEGAPLTAEEIGRIRAWIDHGARAPEEEQPEADPREHWAFRLPVRPPLPDVRNGAWVENPIDLFIAAAHERHGLTPLGRAARPQLLRRVFLDLIGVPPTRDELHAFLADESPDAYVRVVERLLDSPQYGERWGRHWMDVWRYSDWYGRRSVPDVLNSYAQIWRWRDWIVRSLNEDKGYDRMVQEMLAADEIAPADDANLVATGYLVRNFYRWNYNSWMKDNVEHTGKAFLGLTLNCCQCHDHKYDPISQEEYFRFRAFFEPLELRHDRVPGEADPGVFPKYTYGAAYKPITSGMVRVFDEKLEAETYMYSGGEARNIIPGRPPVTPGGPAILGGDRLTIEPIELPPTAWYPGLKAFVQQEETVQREAAVQAAASELNTARETLEHSLPPLLAALQQAEDRLVAVRQQDAEAMTPGALAGSQSLVLDATNGRRVLGHRLPGLGRLESGAVVSYRVKIVKDAHTNLQLGLDVATGATGAYVAFEGGRIQSYRPGTFETFDAGHYEMAAGQRLFAVRLVLDFSTNTAALTVMNVADGTTLVDAVPVALNGWRPAESDNQGLFLDARPGTVAVYDDILVTPPQGEPRVRLDFEPPLYCDGQDVVNVEGWTEPPFSVAPATSRASRMVAHSQAMAQAEENRKIARRHVDAARLSVAAAEAKVAAADAELASIRARIDADKARFLDARGDSDALSRAASRAERFAKVAAARLQVALAEQELAVAEGLPPDDEKRSTAPQQAAQKLTTAKQTLAAVEAVAAEESAAYTLLGPQYPQTSTGRRAALARWLTSTKNPLTARVAVNHLWLRHFGRGLVTTPANFGRSGAAPSHPQLLDWLAVEFMESGWSMKHIHRLIVTSRTYCADSATRGTQQSNEAADPENVFLWRFTPRRLEAEAVRDSILHVAGALERTIGGLEIDQSLGLTTPRRSLYFSHHGEQRMPFLELFDAATPSECYQRTSTIRPQQALAMTNSTLSLEQGRLLARRLWDTAQKDVFEPDAQGRAFVTAVFEQLLTRKPTAEEAEAAESFLKEQAAFLGRLPAERFAAEGDTEVPAATTAAMRARENLIQALFSHNDFVTVR